MNEPQDRPAWNWPRKRSRRDCLNLIEERGANRADWLISIGGIDRILHKDGTTIAIVDYTLAYALLERDLPKPPEKVNLEGLSQEERNKVVLSMMKKGE